MNCSLCLRVPEDFAKSTNLVIPARNAGIPIRAAIPKCWHGHINSVDAGAGLSEIPAAERGYDEDVDGLPSGG